MNNLEEEGDTLLNDILYISEDIKATIIIEDLTQQLQLAKQKNVYYQGENKKQSLKFISRLSHKVKEVESKYKTSQNKKKQINTMQNELQDLYKGNMSTFEAMLLDSQHENSEMVQKSNDLKTKIKLYQAQNKEQEAQISTFSTKVQELNNENSKQNIVIEGLKEERIQLEKVQMDLKLQIENQLIQITNLQVNVENLESQNDTVEAQNDEQKEKLAELNSQLEMIMLEGKQLKDIIQDKDNKFSSKETVLEDVQQEFDTFKSNKNKEVEVLQKEIFQINQSLREIEQKFEDLTNDNEDQKEKIEELQKEVSNANRQVKLLNEQNRKLFSENSLLSMQVTKLEDQLDLFDKQSEKSMTSGSSASHFNEQFSSLEFLLDQEKSRVQVTKEQHKVRHEKKKVMEQEEQDENDEFQDAEEDGKCD